MNSTTADFLESAKDKLLLIGFTGLESDIYLHLIASSGATGYAVSKGIGKAVANVYKALESLGKKGAVEESMSESKHYTAVPWQRFLDEQQKKYIGNINSLAEDLKQLPTQQSDEQIYQLRNIEQVITQSRRIINEAKNILLADLEPLAVELFAEQLVAAVKRGVEVRIKIYELADLPGVNMTLREHGELIYQQTNDISFTICADGSEMMLCLLNSRASKVIQAFRTSSALMNMSIYSGLLYGNILTELKKVIVKGNIKAAQKILKDTEQLHPYSSRNIAFQQFDKSYAINRD